MTKMINTITIDIFLSENLDNAGICLNNGAYIEVEEFVSVLDVSVLDVSVLGVHLVRLDL
jgi:hypothetical protein